MIYFTSDLHLGHANSISTYVMLVRILIDWAKINVVYYKVLTPKSNLVRKSISHRLVQEKK